jgi:hypothetical protein
MTVGYGPYWHVSSLELIRPLNYAKLAPTWLAGIYNVVRSHLDSHQVLLHLFLLCTTEPRNLAKLNTRNIWRPLFNTDTFTNEREGDNDAGAQDVELDVAFDSQHILSLRRPK